MAYSINTNCNTAGCPSGVFNEQSNNHSHEHTSTPRTDNLCRNKKYEKPVEFHRHFRSPKRPELHSMLRRKNEFSDDEPMMHSMLRRKTEFPDDDLLGLSDDKPMMDLMSHRKTEISDHHLLGLSDDEPMMHSMPKEKPKTLNLTHHSIPKEKPNTLNLLHHSMPKEEIEFPDNETKICDCDHECMCYEKKNQK